MWSVQTFCAHTSGELGSGTALGLVLRSKTSLEALSSFICGFGSLVCVMPAFVSSVVVTDGMGFVNLVMKSMLGYSEALWIAIGAITRSRFSTKDADVLVRHH